MDGSQPISVPEQQPANPEVGAEQNVANKLEANVAPVAAEAAQSGPKSDDGAAAAQAQIASVTASDQTMQPAAVPATAAQSTPLVAADVDVIEPEWVKKAEEAVAKNRQDPRAEEKAVDDLQRDYLKQRYNLDVKSGDEKP